MLLAQTPAKQSLSPQLRFGIWTGKILCYSFQAWLDLMCWAFLSLSYSEIHRGLLTGFWHSANFTLVIPPSSFSPPSDRERLFLYFFCLPHSYCSCLTREVQEWLQGKLEKALGGFFFISSGSSCGKTGTEPSCHLELLLPSQELPLPGCVCRVHGTDAVVRLRQNWIRFSSLFRQWHV